MKILITADVHYDISRSRAAAKQLSEQICAEGGDALVLIGDTAGAQLEPFKEALKLFEGFDGRKFLVLGNHCLWCADGEGSLERYEQILPELAAGLGFEVLDHAPGIMGNVALVGSIGWYDYSFADESLGIPEAFYEAKIAPGAARYLGGYDDLLESHRGLITERHLAIGARWMDGIRVRLPFSDRAFSETVSRRLSDHLAEVSSKVDRIVAFVHHLPFRELVPRGRPDRFAFAGAFLGSERLGQVLLEHEKVTHAYCGHSHWYAKRKIEHITAINVGSTYSDKRLETLTIANCGMRIVD